MSKIDELNRAYSEYCERVAKTRGITVEEAKELKVVKCYKECLEIEYNEKVVD